jgi:hypothetical protein
VVKVRRHGGIAFPGITFSDVFDVGFQPPPFLNYYNPGERAVSYWQALVCGNAVTVDRDFYVGSLYRLLSHG